MNETTQQDKKDRVYHVLPGWVTWVQDTFLLSFVVLGEAVILGNLMAIGIVRNIEDPAGWGWFGGIQLAVFLALGMAAAGMGLRCSVAAADAMSRRSWGFFLLNMVGLAVFTISEVWASVSERSANLQPTPADLSVLRFLGLLHNIAISPTIVVVAILTPFINFFWGFSQVKAHHETVEERDARQARELSEAQHKQQLRKVQAVGLVATLKSAGQALTSSGDQAPEEPPNGPPAGPGSPAIAPVRTPHVVGSPPGTIKLVPDNRPRKVAARARTHPKQSVEARVRKVYQPNMSVGELERLSGVSRSSANRWKIVLDREQQFAQ